MSKKNRKKDVGEPPKVRPSAPALPLAKYHRFDENDLPSGLLKWPKDLREPPFSGVMLEVPGLKNGLYYNCWPGGQLKMILNVKKEKVVEWLKLENGTADGCWVAGNIAQKYYSNGQMEDFHPWADSDPPYPAEKSFERWVRQFLTGLSQLMKEQGYHS